MNTTLRVALLAVAGFTLEARQIEPAEKTTIVVYFVNSPAPKDQFVAKALADQIFAPAGVRVVWRIGQPSPRELVKERPIVIRFVTDTPSSDHPGVLAFSVPYEGVHIKIFYDRVRMEAPSVQVVLAHVLVHEITHILQGVVQHSESGIMKARWTAEDYAEMAWKSMSLTREDIMLIRFGLAARAARGTVTQASNMPSSDGGSK